MSIVEQPTRDEALAAFHRIEQGTAEPDDYNLVRSALQGMGERGEEDEDEGEDDFARYYGKWWIDEDGEGDIDPFEDM